MLRSMPPSAIIGTLDFTFEYIKRSGVLTTDFGWAAIWSSSELGEG